MVFRQLRFKVQQYVMQIQLYQYHLQYYQIWVMMLTYMFKRKSVQYSILDILEEMVEEQHLHLWMFVLIVLV